MRTQKKDLRISVSPLIPIGSGGGIRTRAEAFEGTDQILRKYLKVDLLIVDDMGLRQLQRRSGEYLFEVIMRRYENRATIMTSNRPIEEWGKLIGDVPAATATLAPDKGKQVYKTRQNPTGDWLVLKRPSVAGFEPPRDTSDALSGSGAPPR